MSSKKAWERSTNIHMAPQNESGQVAEPRHRVGPKGVSTGISFRELPEPCFHQLKKVCLHYTEKCSGKYESNKMAARYVHQLANEVLFLLSGISEEIQTHQDTAKLAEQRLGEWNTNFPESLKAIGNPHDIANLIKSQKSEIRSLTESLQAERANKERDMSYAMKSMDCQLHASRNGALNERQKLGMEYEKLKCSMEEKLANCEREKDEEIRQLHQYYATELKAKADYHEAVLLNHKAEISSLVATHNFERDKLLAERDSTVDSMSKQQASFKKQLREMQEKIDSQIDSSSVATDDVSLDDISASDSTLFTESAMGSTIPASNDQKSGKRSKESSRKNRKRLRRLMKELNDYKDQCDLKDSEITSLKQQLRCSLNDINSSNLKIASLRECNESLRYRLQSCCRSKAISNYRGDFRDFSDEQQIHHEEQLNVMQHVPHFLHHRTQQSLMPATVERQRIVRV